MKKAIIETEKGDIVLELFPNEAPGTVANFEKLANSGFYDGEDFEKKIVENDVKLYILCSPHNPVCRVWTEEELRKLGQICKKYGVIVISDEIHCDFAFPEHPHIPIVKACPEMMDSTIICTAPSKTFNLAGLQVSNIFVPGEELRKKLEREMEVVRYRAPNMLGVIACQAAYEQGGQWL
ncbi:MAG: aminotransferase class I/II-fold pyridoxal phosphate-dependent enzyme, partial [Methanobrevibacter sp.]|nr:aminotransferase class I/II-fold pyridoxal phosphate-dependent enzyme [Methanobrevibacter sp.]